SAWTQRIGKYWNGSAWIAFITYFSNAWDTLTQSGTGTFGGGGAWTTSYIHTIGGESGSGTSTTINRRYNPVTTTWDSGAAFPQGFFRGQAVAVGEELYLNAGSNGGFRSYSNTTNSWATLSYTLANSTSNALVKISDTKFFHHGTSSTEVQTYDVVSNTWTTVATLSSVRTGAFGGYIDGKVYLASSTPATSIYDVASNTWSTGLAMTTSKSQGASGVLNGMFICASGTTSTNNSASGTINNIGYTPSTNTWTALTVAPAARHHPSFGISPDGSKMFMANGRSTGATVQQLLYIFR
ncbi:hypothetical protein AB4Z21_25525, partial [Paenibacillus sp. MCAF20]